MMISEFRNASNWGSREGKFLKAENNGELEQPARALSLIPCCSTAQMVSSLPDASPFFGKIAKHLLCENVRELIVKSQCLGVRRFLTEMHSVYDLSECQFVGWYCSFKRCIPSFSVFSLSCISRQGEWFAGLDMSLRFANRALQGGCADICQMAEHPCSPVYDDGTKSVSP